FARWPTWFVGDPTVWALDGRVGQIPSGQPGSQPGPRTRVKCWTASRDILTISLLQGLSDRESRMLSPARELESFKFLDRLSTHLKRAQGSQKALRHVLRDARELLDATPGCIGVAREGGPGAQLLFAVPRDGKWDLDLLGRFIRHEHLLRPVDLLIAPLRRRGGAWAALAFMRPGRPFERYDGHLLGR